jgi:hypothetical protein
MLQKKLEYNEIVHQLFVDFWIIYDTIRGEVQNNILIKFGVTVKLVRLIRICWKWNV